MKIFIVEVLKNRGLQESIDICRVEFEKPESDGPITTLKSIAKCRIETEYLRMPEKVGRFQILSVYDSGV